MKGKFKVGDRVKCVSDGGWGKPIAGKYGVIKEVRREDYGVKFDDFIEGHDLGGDVEYGYCWYCDENMLIKAESETIVIYRKGNDVIALDKANNKKAVARCNPEDTFNFETGARLAFERLFEAKKTPLNTKIVFTDGDDVFKTGHIYEIKDGNLADPRYKRVLPGGAKENFTKFYSIEELEDYFKARGERNLHDTGWSFRTLKFIEVKED